MGEAFSIESLYPLAGPLVYLRLTLGTADPVQQIHQSVIIDAAMLTQADLAGAAGADAFLTVPHGGFQAAQRVIIQLWGGKAFVTGKAAAVNAFWDDYFRGAATHDVDQTLCFAQVLRTASDVYRDRFVLWGDRQPVEQLLADKLHRVVQFQSCVQAILNQAQGARAGVAVDRVEAAATGLEQRVDQLLFLALGLLAVALRGNGWPQQRLSKSAGNTT